MTNRTPHTGQTSVLAPDQHQLLGHLVAEAIAILRRKGRMTEVDALVSLQSILALASEALLGSRPAAVSLRELAEEVEKRGLEPLRLPMKNEVAEDGGPRHPWDKDDG
ncbi:hypothetical protein [Ensifer aridi]|uniref:hypothetical protein n=1 Tax=Ensifer aridi TaxID=1708715 RepID=UPI0004799FDA|nr:hypothetical protein [Ensifer aridi]